MRLRMALVAALILVGCSRGVQPQGPVPTAPVRLTPESSGVRAQLPPPVDRVKLCTPVLSGVRPAIGADWVRASDGPCWVEWHQASSGLQVQLYWSEAESESWVYKLRTVPIEGGRYQGQLGQQMMEKTGGAFWGPNAWALEVTGERGRVTVTCGMDVAPDREQGRARQVQVDAACPDLLSRTVVGDLGKPVP